MLKKILFAAFLLAGLAMNAEAQRYEYKIVTTVESIVPMGLGRSRIIEATEEKDAAALTTSRNKGTDSDQGNVKRRDVKVDELDETKLMNFYSGVGINFQNIASNDAVVTSKLNQLSEDGWDLFTVASGVESNAGKDDGDGIFITRYVFRRAVQ